MNQLIQDLKNRIITKKALVWDFDGVIFFSNWIYNEPLEVYLERKWKMLEKFEPDIRNVFKDGAKYYYENTDYVISRHNASVRDKINQFYLEKELAILPGMKNNAPVIEFIKSLNSDIENYIWSNNQSEFIRILLDSVGLSNNFKAIASLNKMKLGKPNLDGFEIIKDVSEIKDINGFLLIGDSLNTDGEAAKKLGMDFFHLNAK